MNKDACCFIHRKESARAGFFLFFDAGDDSWGAAGRVGTETVRVSRYGATRIDCNRDGSSQR